MPKYQFIVEAPAAFSITVEADSMKEAIKIAQRKRLGAIPASVFNPKPDAWTPFQISMQPTYATLVDFQSDTEEFDLAETFSNAKRMFEHESE